MTALSASTTPREASVAKREALLEELTAGIAELASSQEWERYLTVASRFTRYSFLNTLAIFRQRPEITRAQGFHTWKSVGRSVKKGSKGIAILCPVVPRLRVHDDQTGEDQLVIATPTRFRIGYVFAYEDTEGEPLPEAPCQRLSGDDADGHYARLADVARAGGYTVEEDFLPGEVNGNCDFVKRRICVEVGNDPLMQVKTLVHEVAHSRLHDPATGWSGTRECAELEAESVAFVVCRALGIESGAYSFGYVTVWAGGGTDAITAIRTAGARILRTADEILTAVGIAEERAA